MTAHTRSWMEPLEDRCLLSTPAESAAASVAYLGRDMDQFNTRVPVYDDVSSPGNRFVALAAIPDGAAPIAIDTASTVAPHAGATCIRCQYTGGSSSFGGFDFLNGVLNGGSTPQLNFGQTPNAGVNLSGAAALTFWARGQTGHEVVDFLMGGAGYEQGTGAANQPYPDSTRTIKITRQLSTAWQQYRIDLRGANLSYVLNGFGWMIDGAKNPSGAVFYLDDIQYDLGRTAAAQRLNLPRLLQSYSTLPVQSARGAAGNFDLVFRNAAFTYDNALAAIAFLSDGSADGLRRAQLIGDALIYAAGHDRSFSDGRLRSVYSSGDISLPPGWLSNGVSGATPAPGYMGLDGSFHELWSDGTRLGAIDTGDNAWAMIAMLALYRRTGAARYLDEARKLGNVINTFRNNSGTYQGFLGGINNPESGSPTARAYASSEHNLDVFAAFSTMYAITRDATWLDGAKHAGQFLESMWDPSINAYRAGTDDPQTRNTRALQLPLDVQAWSILAVPGVLRAHPQLLNAAGYFRTTQGRFWGYDFNNDKDGIWFEGTGQMAVAYSIARQTANADAVRALLRQAQNTRGFGDGLGIAAASHDGLTTGFSDRSYMCRLHVGATAWNIFAQIGFNPFYDNGTRQR